MQIVIDIPEALYEALLSEYEEPYSRMFSDVVKNGTPLPKGHGRLIDGDELASRMKIGYCIVRDAPTIIEADKAGEEE